MPTDKKIIELPVATSVNASDISVLVNGGADYQYTFTLLLQFLEANLVTGAKVTFGTMLPQNTTGNNGDVFINTSAGSFAQKVSGTWTVVYTLPAANGADGTLLYGAGVPGSGTGKNADSYINTLTGIFHLKTAGAWSQVFSMATGPAGPPGTPGTNGTNGTDGNTILYGTVNPSNSATGVDGNFYINTSTYKIFGPKASGVWPAGISVIGEGLPVGGTTGQVLAKVDGTDFSAHWADNSFANLSGAPGDNTTLAAALAAKQNSLGFTAENTANKNQPGGYAGLDGSGKVASAQLPSYVDDVLEFANFAALPSTGETGKIYVTLNDNAEYRWSGSNYIQLVASPGSTDAVPEGSTNLYFTVSRVLAVVLTGIGFSSATAITATDTILGALGKLQAQITALFKVPTGGTTGQILAKIDGTDGNTQWITPSSGGGSPGGSSNQVQYNSGGAFGGNSRFTIDPTTYQVYIKGQNYASLVVDAPVQSNITLKNNGADQGYINGDSGGLVFSTYNGAFTFSNGNLNAGFGSFANLKIGKSDASTSYNIFGSGSSSNLQQTYSYANNAEAFVMGNSGGLLVSPQNFNDWIISASGNIGFADYINGTQTGVFAMFMRSSKSFILNGGGSFTDNSSAIFQMYSNTKGMLPPTMTTSQKTSIASAAEGLIVYDTTLHKLCVYTGSTWETISSS